MQLSARPASSDDLESLKELYSAALAASAAERGGSLFVRLDLPPLESFVGEAERVAVVGEIDGAPLGLGLASLVASTDGARPVARLQLLFVEPGARGVGLGEAVASEVAAWASAKGATGVDAVVLPGVREAKNFLESSGYVARLIVMHRPLGDPEG